MQRLAVEETNDPTLPNGLVPFGESRPSASDRLAHEPLASDGTSGQARPGAVSVSRRCHLAFRSSRASRLGGVKRALRPPCDFHENDR